MSGQIRKDDVGTVLRIQVTEYGLPFNASASTLHTLTFKKPSGHTSAALPVEFETNGVDGIFRYVTQPGDLDESGPWQGQIFLEAPNGQWHSECFAFQVGENINPTALVVAPVGRLRL